MKFNSVALTLATAGSLVAAQHNHGHHRHHIKRTPQEVAPTVVAYSLNGVDVPAEEVCKGIAQGTLEFTGGDIPSEACKGYLSSSAVAASSSSTPTPSSAILSSPASATPSSSSVDSSSSSSSTVSSSAAPSATPGGSATSDNVDKDFPDGEIDCDSFPSEYGAVPLHYLGLQGWSGIQYVDIVGQTVSNIITAVTGDKCTHGAMCSYACPAGYQKSQWPSTQGATGQSVGGISCKNGKLHLTNPSLSKKLCIPGAGGVQAQNNVGEHVSVCRTDYPGTEGETIPVSIAHGDTKPLACPNGNSYFKWLGKVTTAQYYVNNKGVSTETACQWGSAGKPVGNWAPLNLGVGESDSGKWLSMFKNSPTTNSKLDFNVKIEGDNLGGTCKYENGQYISDAGTNENGCTVKVLSGNATYVFY